jgi:exodeoxyribonuclease VII large subunit
MNSISTGDPSNRDIYKVTRLNREVRAVLEGSFPLLWVQGEISNLARPASGHIYFSLKDQHSQVRCAMFKNRLRSVKFAPENGMEILTRANVSLYEGRGEFQLIVEHIEPAGEGALQRAFEELKQGLHKEGLFEELHKKKLPAYPGTITVITSPSGAAIRDILQVLNRRYPLAEVNIYPVPVQGETSAEKIVKAIQLAEQRQQSDVIILARGGGSLEDLWSFNEEVVARAVYQCSIPVVTGIGHEIDFTIADFVADQRAPTPSAAAELISPDIVELQNNLKQFEFGLIRHMRGRFERYLQALKQLEKRMPHPARQLQNISQGLDDISLRMQQAMKGVFANKRADLLQISGEINHFNPLQALKLNKEKCQFLNEQLQSKISHLLEIAEARMKHAAHALHTVSPLATLERGYAIVSYGEDNKVVRNADELKENDEIKTRLGKGQLISQVKKILPDDK